MADERIHADIDKMVAEEHELWDREAAGSASDDDRRRVRSAETVEHYQQ